MHLDQTSSQPCSTCTLVTLHGACWTEQTCVFFNLEQGGCSGIRGGPATRWPYYGQHHIPSLPMNLRKSATSNLCTGLLHSCCKEIMETGRSPGVTADSDGLVLLGVMQQPPVQCRTSGRHGAIAFSQPGPGADKPQPRDIQLHFMEPSSLGSLELLAQGTSLEWIALDLPSCLLSSPHMN